MNTSRGIRIAIAVLWLLAWAAFGIAWGGMTAHPQPERIAWFLSPGRRAIADAILNVIFYVPFGELGTSWGFRWKRVMAVGASLSLVTELTQLFSVTRVPSLMDVVFNTSGVALGIIWALYAGVRVGAGGFRPPGSSSTDALHDAARGQPTPVRTPGRTVAAYRSDAS